jgi:hypothetical protein
LNEPNILASLELLEIVHKLEKTCMEIKILLRLATDLPKKPIIVRISDFGPCLDIHGEK